MSNNESIKDTLDVIRRALEDENAFSQNNENVLILNKKVNDDGTVKLLSQSDDINEINRVIDNKLDDWGVLSNVIHSDGEYYDLLKTNGGVSTNQKIGFIEMAGKEIFKHAVEKLSLSFQEALKLSYKNIEQIDWLIPHQANQRIIDATANRLELSPNQVMVNIEKYGNTTSATIPLLLYDYESKLKKGDKIVFAAFGGGFSWGSIYFKWSYNNN